MAIALEFVNVIVRKAAVERNYPGGLDAFARQESLPNYLEDDRLVRVGFMSTSEALGFVERLEAAGLRDTDDGDSDIAVISSVGGMVPAWLAVGECAGHWACWLAARPPGQLVETDPVMLLRWPAGPLGSLAELIAMLRQGGVAVTQREVHGGLPDTVLLRCVRGAAEIDVEVFPDPVGGRPIGVWGRRDLARRSQRDDDVALMGDLTAVLMRGGAADR